MAASAASAVATATAFVEVAAAVVAVVVPLGLPLQLQRARHHRPGQPQVSMEPGSVLVGHHLGPVEALVLAGSRPQGRSPNR